MISVVYVIYLLKAGLIDLNQAIKIMI